MILYNVTVSVDEDIAEEWVKWMREKHIPDVMATGKFIESKLSRVLGEEEGGITYAVQYLCKDRKTFDAYTLEDAPALQKEHSDRYEGKFAAFRTLLNVVHQQKQDG